MGRSTREGLTLSEVYNLLMDEALGDHNPLARKYIVTPQDGRGQGGPSVLYKVQVRALKREAENGPV